MHSSKCQSRCLRDCCSFGRSESKPQAYKQPIAPCYRQVEQIAIFPLFAFDTLDTRKQSNPPPNSKTIPTSRNISTQPKPCLPASSDTVRTAGAPTRGTTIVPEKMTVLVFAEMSTAIPVESAEVRETVQISHTPQTRPTIVARVGRRSASDQGIPQSQRKAIERPID